MAAFVRRSASSMRGLYGRDSKLQSVRKRVFVTCKMLLMSIKMDLMARDMARASRRFAKADPDHPVPSEPRALSEGLELRLDRRYGRAVVEPEAGFDERMGKATVDRLLAHRSVRRYRQKELEPGTLELLIAAAQSAASSSNLQLWSVVNVTDPELRRGLSLVAGDQEQVRKAAPFLVWVADLHRAGAIARIANRGPRLPGIVFGGRCRCGAGCAECSGRRRGARARHGLHRGVAQSSGAGERTARSAQTSLCRLRVACRLGSKTTGFERWLNDSSRAVRSALRGTVLGSARSRRSTLAHRAWRAASLMWRAPSCRTLDLG